MSLIVDDLLIRPFVFIADAIHTLALNEMYDVEEIRADLKENQLLYEIGDRSESEYRRIRTELQEELEVAEQARENLQNKSIEVRG